MIKIFELELLSAIKAQWTTMIAAIGSDTDMIPDIFGALPTTGQWNGNQASIADIFTAMATGNTDDDLRFVLQFPVGNASIPCIDVEVGNEQEDPVVGEFINSDINTDTGKLEIQSGSVYAKSFSIGVFSTNPATTLYLYSFVKYCVLLLRDSFQAVSIANTSGMPMQLDSKSFAPSMVYIRYLNINTNGCLDYCIKRNDVVVAATSTPIVVPQVYGTSVQTNV